MKSLNLSKSVLFAVALIMAVSQSVMAADVWITDLEAAKTQAAAEKKDILIFFTGSTWCSYCIKMEQKVFGTPEFQNEAPKNFVLVKVDFPEETNKASNESKKLYVEYGAEGFPTLILTDAAGKSYAETGYLRGVNGTVYTAHLNVLREDGQKGNKLLVDGLAEKDEATKVKMLSEGLLLLTDNGASIGNYLDEVKALAIADKAGTAIFSGKSTFRQLYVNIVGAQISVKVQGGDFATAHGLVDTLLNEVSFKPEEKQMVLFQIKGRLFEVAKLVPKALEIYNEALKLAPTSPLAPKIEERIKALESSQSDILDVN